MSTASRPRFSAGRAYTVHAFGKTAFFFKGFGLGGNLAVEQAAGHGDQNQCSIGGNFSSVFRDVPDAPLPSAIFCTPLRAACTIWSRVRLKRSA
jgi:hypothetical protein